MMSTFRYILRYLSHHGVVFFLDNSFGPSVWRRRSASSFVKPPEDDMSPTLTEVAYLAATSVTLIWCSVTSYVWKRKGMKGGAGREVGRRGQGKGNITIKYRTMSWINKFIIESVFNVGDP